MKSYQIYANIKIHQRKGVTKMKMGEYIKQLRIERGWTQEELGEKVGVNRAAVNKWETGLVENIKRSTIRDLSRVFGVSPCDLMRWDDEETLQTVQKEVETCELFQDCYGKEAFNAVTIFLKLDAADRLRIIERMETLLEADKYSVKKESNAV